jgi:hypothetical protein
MTSGASVAIDQMENKGKVRIIQIISLVVYVYAGSSWHWPNSVRNIQMSLFMIPAQNSKNWLSKTSKLKRKTREALKSVF